jgi:glycosyltransferase involved in cell wall biosynthesis
MTISHKTIVVVPCYNEAARLPTDEFEKALRENANLEFVFVDDGSSDDTSGVIQRLRQAAGERAHLLALPKNSGKAEAVRQGVLHAFSLGPEYLGYWDADLSTPLRAIGDFARVLDERNVSLVMGARVQLLGRKIERNPVRHYIGRAFASLASIALALPVYDTQCGAKLFRATPVVREVFAQPFSLGWTFDVELLGRMQEQFAKVGVTDLLRECVEYPLEEWVDIPGSKLKPKHFLGILVELGQIFLRRKRGRH